jgi:hypothetical protein
MLATTKPVIPTYATTRLGTNPKNTTAIASVLKEEGWKFKAAERREYRSADPASKIR